MRALLKLSPQGTQKGFQWRFHLAIVTAQDKWKSCCHTKKNRQETEHKTSNVCACVTKLSLNNASLHRKYTESITKQSTRRCSLRFRLFLRERSQVIRDFSDTSSDGLEEHNARNFMLELFSHAHIGIYMEVLVDEKKNWGTALSCHFALDILCDTSEFRCAQ